MHHQLTPAAVASLLEPLERFRHSLLAVSGGSDSTALMRMAAAWRDARSDAPKISVATVDHEFRPSSQEEAISVRCAAEALRFPHTVLSWSGERPAGGIEDAARVIRYGLLINHAYSIGADAIVTAHTMDDQAETVLMRLARGSGVDGLSAMAVDTQLSGLRLLRPLLCVQKAQLVAWLHAQGATWIEDETNVDARFERARLRQAQAGLSALGLTPAALARTASRMRRARASLETSAEDWIVEHVRFEPCGFASVASGPLLALPDEVALRVLERLVGAVGGKTAPPSLAGLERLLDALEAQPGRTATFAGCRIERAGDNWRMIREIRRSGLEALPLKAGQSGLWDGRFRVALSGDAAFPVEVRALGTAGLTEIGSGALRDVPARAAQACAAFWREETLLAAPPLGWRRDTAPPVSAEFLHD